MLVEKVMNRHVITATPETTLLEAAQIMADNHIGCIVVTKGKKPVGMLTERDVLIAVASEANVKKIKIGSIMTHYLITIGPKRPVSKAITLMADNKIKKLPVVNDEGKLVGIVTASDIMSVEPEAVKRIKHLISMRFFKK